MRSKSFFFLLFCKIFCLRFSVDIRNKSSKQTERQTDRQTDKEIQVLRQDPTRLTCCMHTNQSLKIVIYAKAYPGKYEYAVRLDSWHISFCHYTFTYIVFL